MQGTASPEKSTIRKIGRRLVQKLARSSAQLRDLWSAVALQPEGCGAARGVIAAILFRLDDQGPALGRDLCSKAGAGDAAADYYDVPLNHLADGYELESRAV
jgi:hypothetical protein